MKDAHITLYDVAARAGVSASTASRALAGLAVNKANRAAVEMAAAELGYVANEAARSLRVVKTMTVGMVFFELTSMIGMELLGSLTSSLDKMGYSLFVSTAQGDPARLDRLVRRFLERRVDALLCVHGQGDGAALEGFRRAGVPAMGLITSAGGFADLPLVSNGIEEAAAQCVASLTERGHQTIGVIMPHRPSHILPDLLKAAGRRGLALDGFRDPEGRLEAARLVVALPALARRPTVIAGSMSDVIAVFQAADAAGVEVPQSLSLVAVRDRSTFVPPTRLPLSTIHLEPARVGVKAAEVLAAWFEGEPPKASDIHVQVGSWIDRGTTAAAPQL